MTSRLNRMTPRTLMGAETSAILHTQSARLVSVALVVALLSACAVTPAYERPDLPMPAVFKEAGATWAPAAPADALDRGPWWEMFGDAELNRLSEQVQLSNQNIAAAVAEIGRAHV